MASSELSGQELPRRPRDWDDEPDLDLEPARDLLRTSPGRRMPPRPSPVSSPAPVPCRCELDTLPANYSGDIPRAHLWIAVAASSAIAVIVSELLRAAAALFR